MPAEQQATRDEMIQEAVRRMRTLQLPTERIEHFEREGQLLMAEDLPHGRLVLSSGDGRLRDLAAEVEAETGMIVYAGHLAHAFPFDRTVGCLWTLFGVSPDPSQWARENSILRENRIAAFVIGPGQAGKQDVPFRVLSGALLRAEG